MKLHVCANILGSNIHARFKFSCVRLSHGLCARAHAHSLEGTLILLSMTSSVKFSLSVLVPQNVSNGMGTSEQQQCYELLNFIIQLDLISNFHDSVALPGNDVRGHNMNFPLLLCPGFCLINPFT